MMLQEVRTAHAVVNRFGCIVGIGATYVFAAIVSACRPASDGLRHITRWAGGVTGNSIIAANALRRLDTGLTLLSAATVGAAQRAASCAASTPELVKENDPVVDDQPDIARYVADGVLQRVPAWTDRRQRRCDG